MKRLTNEVEAEALKLINKIDELGGSVAAIEQGFMQNEIARSAYAYQQKIESGEKIIVGVNKFKTRRNRTPASFKINDSIRQIQIDKLNLLKRNKK